MLNNNFLSGMLNLCRRQPKRRRRIHDAAATAADIFEPRTLLSGIAGSLEPEATLAPAVKPLADHTNILPLRESSLPRDLSFSNRGTSLPNEQAGRDILSGVSNVWDVLPVIVMTTTPDDRLPQLDHRDPGISLTLSLDEDLWRKSKEWSADLASTSIELSAKLYVGQQGVDGAVRSRLDRSRTPILATASLGNSVVAEEWWSVNIRQLSPMLQQRANLSDADSTWNLVAIFDSTAAGFNFDSKLGVSTFLVVVPTNAGHNNLPGSAPGIPDTMTRDPLGRMASQGGFIELRVPGESKTASGLSLQSEAASAFADERHDMPTIIFLEEPPFPDSAGHEFDAGHTASHDLNRTVSETSKLENTQPTLQPSGNSAKVADDIDWGNTDQSSAHQEHTTTNSGSEYAPGDDRPLGPLPGEEGGLIELSAFDPAVEDFPIEVAAIRQTTAPLDNGNLFQSTGEAWRPVRNVGLEANCGVSQAFDLATIDSQHLPQSSHFEQVENTALPKPVIEPPAAQEESTPSARNLLFRTTTIFLISIAGSALQRDQAPTPFGRFRKNRNKPAHHA